MKELAKEVVEMILQHGKIYEVGGAVRDKYLFGKNISKDHDYLVTGIPFDELSKKLKKHGKVDLVGRSFGVIKFTRFIDGEPQTYDIALPRKDISTGAGHKDFNVDFDPNLSVEDDLYRRDFTINAMAISLDDNQLIDPLKGLEDLKSKKIRMVYKDSFKDDPLRMLRAIQFAARFEFEIDADTVKAMKKHANLINTISPERIAEELNKLLELSEKPSIGFRIMQASGIMKEILPELEICVSVDQPGGYHKYDVFEHTLYVIDACPKNLRLRMASLFHDINKPQHRRLVDKGATFYGHESSGSKTAKKVLKRLRYPNDFIKDVQVLVERHMFTTDVTDKGLRRLVKKVGVDLIFDLLDLRRADVVGQGMGGTTEDVDQFESDIKDELAKKPPISINSLAINGNDLMKSLKIKQGKKVGLILDYLLEQVLDNPELNSVDTLNLIAEEYYKSIIKNTTNKDKD
jgi:tRNA nucleotidyltransferase (CCA-adding enzyme)